MDKYGVAGAVVLLGNSVCSVRGLSKGTADAELSPHEHGDATGQSEIKSL